MDNYFLLSNKIKNKPFREKKIEREIKILDENGIIPLMKGGLGNQIFIIAAAFTVHKYLKCNLFILNNPPSKHNFLNNDYNKTIFRYIGTHINKDQTDKVYLDTLFEKGYKVSYVNKKSRDKAYSFWNFRNIPKKTIMGDFYQFYPCIKPYENELQNLLLKGLEDFINIIQNKLGSLKNSIFIHVRRGDYLALSFYYYVQPISYYENAYKLLLEKSSDIDKIFILSDDLNWVKEQEFFNNLSNKEYYESNNELEILSLMTLCEKGAICANSTFSWWGAFLGAYRFNNPVFVPNKWCLDKTNELFPKTWYKID